MTFIRIKWIPSGKGMRPYFYLVRNYREDGKVKQEIVEYLGLDKELLKAKDKEELLRKKLIEEKD